MADFTKLNGYTVKDPYAVHTYDTVVDLKADTKLKAGNHAQTKGYTTAGDGGNGVYIIVDDNTLVDDGGSVHELSNGLFAVLLIDEYVTPKMFGAKGDGEHDDTDTLQKTVNYASVNGYDVKLPKGTYIFTTLLIKENVKFIGDSGILKVKDNLCVDNTATYYLVRMESNTTIKDVEIDGNKENNTLFLVADSITTAGNNITIDGCHLYNVIDSGIMFSETIDSIVKNCRIDDARDCGIYCNNNNTDKIMHSVIMNNIIKNAGASGIAMKRGCRYITIEENNIIDCTNGITNEQASTSTDFSKEFSILYNTIYCSTVTNGAGIDTRCGYNSNIIGNRIINITTAINAQGSHDLNIEANIVEFHANATVTTNVYGVLLQGRASTDFNYCYNINVLNNIFNFSFFDSSSYQQHVMRINNSDNSSNIVISGNKITGDAYTSGITTGNAINDLIITNNTIKIGASATAYALQGINLFANNKTVSGNVMFSKAQYFAIDNYHRYFTNTSTSAPSSSTDYINGDVIFAKYGSGSVFAWMFDGTNFKAVNFS